MDKTRHPKTNEPAHAWLPLIGLSLLFVLLYVLPLGLRPLAIPDETRYAEIPHEMLVSGDWVTPRLNGLRYFEKPPLGYWINAIAQSLLGNSNFAVRITTSIATAGTLILVYLFSLKLFKHRQTATLIGFIYLSSTLVYLLGTYNLLDSLFNLLLSAGIMSYALAALASRKSRARLYWISSGIALGLAFLAKGFLALALPVLVLVPWLVWQRRWKALFIHGWLVIMVAGLVVLPWGLRIYRAEADFWHYFFWIEHIKRFTSEQAQHKAPFYYFLLYFPLLAFPWFSLIPAALSGLKVQYRRRQEVLRLLGLWLLLPFMFFSLSSGKLATYVLPCFPPLAMLLGLGLEQYFQRSGRRLFDWGIYLNLLVVALASMTLIGLQLYGGQWAIYSDSETIKAAVLLLALSLSMAGGVLALKGCSLQKRTAGVIGFLIPLTILLTVSVPDISKQGKAPGQFIRQAAAHIDDKTLIISSGAMLRAVNWYLNRQDVYLLDADEVAYGLSYADATGRLLGAKKFRALLHHARGRSIALFCHEGCPKAIRPFIPPDAFKQEYGVFSFYRIQG